MIALAGSLTSAACGSTTSPSSTTTTTGADTWSGIMQPKGGVSRSIAVTKAGTIQLQLSTMSPNDVAVGFGFGQYDASFNCVMTNSLVTVADATTQQITADVQAGTYCVRLYDAGGMVQATTYLVTITKP